MKVYMLNVEDDSPQHCDKVLFCGTQAEVHNAAKLEPKRLWDGIVIEEREVATDKEGVLAMLNGTPRLSAPSSTWCLTSRGGMDRRAPR